MLRLSIKIVLLVFLPLSPMTVGAIESYFSVKDTVDSYPRIIDGRYRIDRREKPIYMLIPSDSIVGYETIYDTTDLWLENGIDTIVCSWEKKIVGYQLKITEDRGENWCYSPARYKKDTTFTYAYPPDSVLVCDTTYIDSSKIMHPDAVIVDKLLPDEYEIDSTDVTDYINKYENPQFNIPIENSKTWREE